MSPMRQHAKTKRDLPTEEWDFTEIQEWELVPALQYEYARSCDRLRAAIEHWHKAPFSMGCIQGAGSEYLEGLLAALGNRRGLTNAEAIRIAFDRLRPDSAAGDLTALLSRIEATMPPLVRALDAQRIAGTFDVFPEAWLKIKSVRTEEYLRRRCVIPVPAKAPARQGSSRIKKFPADLSLPRGELVTQFRHWLDKQNQRASLDSRRKPGRRAPWNRLKRLAAYRMSEAGVLYDKAILLIDRHAGDVEEIPEAKVLPLYRSENAWKKAVALVEEELRGNFIAAILA